MPFRLAVLSNTLTGSDSSAHEISTLLSHVTAESADCLITLMESQFTFNGPVEHCRLSDETKQLWSNPLPIHHLHPKETTNHLKSFPGECCRSRISTTFAHLLRHLVRFELGLGFDVEDLQVVLSGSLDHSCMYKQRGHCRMITLSVSSDYLTDILYAGEFSVN